MDSSQGHVFSCFLPQAARKAAAGERNWAAPRVFLRSLPALGHQLEPGQTQPSPSVMGCWSFGGTLEKRWWAWSGSWWAHTNILGGLSEVPQQRAKGWRQLHPCGYLMREPALGVEEHPCSLHGQAAVFSSTPEPEPVATLSCQDVLQQT